MPKEKSIGAVVFRQHGTSQEFLLLHYNAGHWGFPKGHSEEGESEQQTMLRELREETGLSQIEIAPGFSQHSKYFFKRAQETVFKQVVFYLAEAKAGSVSLSHEHQGFEWLPFEQALERLSFKNTKQVLRRAGGFLQQKSNNKK